MAQYIFSHSLCFHVSTPFHKMTKHYRNLGTPLGWEVLWCLMYPTYIMKVYEDGIDRSPRYCFAVHDATPPKN